jgi:Flp pilus assembly protein TadG
MASMTLRRGSERGAALVEFALVLPLLLVVIAGIVDFGFLFQRYEVLTNAAREGARLASLPGYITCPAGGGAATASTSIDMRVRSYVQQGLSLSDAAMTTVMPTGSVDVWCDTMAVTNPSGGTIDVSTVRVEVSYVHSFLMLDTMLGLINKNWGDEMTLTGRSVMRLESPSAPPPPAP